MIIFAEAEYIGDMYMFTIHFIGKYTFCIGIYKEKRYRRVIG